MNSPIAQSAGAGRKSLRDRIALQSWWLARNAAKRSASAVRNAPHAMADKSLSVMRKLAQNDSARALGLVQKARRVRPGSAFLARAEAILISRVKGWNAAGPAFAAAAATGAPGLASGLLRNAPTPPVELALPAPVRAADLSASAAAGIVIYTAVFGEDPAPQPQFYDIPGLRLLCLTDRDGLAVAGWQTVQVTPPTAIPADAAAWCRILPHRALAEAAPDAGASLYAAPDLWLVGNLHTLLARWCLPHDLVLARHPHGIDWQDLAEQALISGAPDTGHIIAQAQDCEARRLPRNGGACATDMIWRRHGSPEVAALMEAWWAERERVPGLDEISFYAALHDPAKTAPIEPRILPAVIASATANAVVQPAPRRLVRGAKPAIAKRPIPVVIVYHMPHANSATTELRARQLATIINRRYPDEFEVTHAGDSSGIRDQVVILLKHAITDLSLDGLADLRRRNIAVISAWEDSVPDPARALAVDANLTVSYRQTRDHVRMFPNLPTYLVGHHVNMLIRPSTPPMDSLRAGYFGDIANTYCPDSMRNLVDLVSLDTINVEMNWIDRLPEYNCHWVVRRYRTEDDGGKPFLKGFVAARCGAVVVAGRNDDDALEYLGDDYPFYVRGTDSPGLEYQMANIAAAFGGPEWRYAQEIMAQMAARSSDEVFSGEFRAMVRDIVG